MADKRCFVQFPHPGNEHKPTGDSTIGWNKILRNGKVNPHKRKFLQFHGEWIDEGDEKHSGNLRAWGEWEPESKVIRNFDVKECKPHHPSYLWKPYWVPKNTYRYLHNTDPFIFGDCFLYSNCRQSASGNQGLKQLGQGSVIAFGSGKKIGGQWSWVLDTVFVVKDSFPYNPLYLRRALEGKVPTEFLEVTGGPLAAWAGKITKGSASAACAPTSERLRLYRGATPQHRVDGMFSFFPAIPAVGDSCFPRPVVSLDDKYFNSSNCLAAKGAGRTLSFNTIRGLWHSLVEQVHNDGLVLGTRAEMPERRAG